MRLIRKKPSDIRKEKKHHYYIIFIALFFVLIGLIFFLKKINLNNFLSNFSLTKKNLIIPIAKDNSREMLITALAEKNILVDSFKEEGNDTYHLFLKNNIEVFLDSKDLQNKVASLQFILQRFKIEGREIKVIDLRFQKPVVK